MKVFKNKILWYIFTRYITYTVQFVSLFFLANILGPHDYGIWSFIVMLLSYLSILNFGIGNSTNVLLIQNKANANKLKNIISSGFATVALLFIPLIAYGITYYFNPGIFNKYSLNIRFYLILVIGALQYLNLFLTNIYRAFNRLVEVAIYQSSVPFLILLNLLFVPKLYLIDTLLYSYIAANLFSFLLYFFSFKYPHWGRPNISDIFAIIKKGFFLFLYNSAFYLILTTSSTFVSSFYPINEYGKYSFSYSLGHSILLMMDAFAYILTPKVLDKLYTKEINIIERTLKTLNINYVSLTYCLMFIAIALFPYFITLFPKYEDALPLLIMMTLSIILNINSFPYTNLLIANNKEKLCAQISVISLVFNIIICYIVMNVFHVPYYFTSISIMVSYLLFSILFSYFSHKYIYGCKNGFIRNLLPINLLVPYLIAFILTILKLNYLLFIPLLIYFALNVNNISEIIKSIKLVINSPKLVDINIKSNNE